MQDGSTNNHTVAINGNTKITPAGPFDKQYAYSAATHGGFAHLDGNEII